MLEVLFLLVIVWEIKYYVHFILQKVKGYSWKQTHKPVLSTGFQMVYGRYVRYITPQR